MKKRTWLILVTSMLLSGVLYGCQDNTAAKHSLPNDEAKTSPAQTGTTFARSSSTEEAEAEASSAAEADRSASARAYQFVKGQGIIKSEYPVFVLDADKPPQLTENDVTVKLLSAIYRNQELYAEFKIEDRSAKAIEAAEEAMAEDEYITINEDISIPKRGYMKHTWGSGKDLVLEGPGITEYEGRPKTVSHSSDDHFLEHYGYIRYFMRGIFETKPLDFQNNPSGYFFRIPEFSTPLEISMKPAPGYDSLEELAKERGGMDTHDGYTIFATAEAVDDGILVDLYTYNEEARRMAVQTVSPKENVPVLSQDGKTYPAKSNAAYQGPQAYYHMDEVTPGTQNLQFLYDVPKTEQNASFMLTVPGITLPVEEMSSHITLDIPEDFSDLDTEILFQEGKLHLHGITRLEEPQEYREIDNQGNVVLTEKPAVYIELSTETVSNKKEIKHITCRRKADDAVWYMEDDWENQKGDFDENQNIKGFYVFFENGDEEITIIFTDPLYYWNQPYEIPLQVSK